MSDNFPSPKMIDVSAKKETLRLARAHGRIEMSAQTKRAIEDKKIEKGDVLEIAKLAAIMAAKETARFLPLCHPLSLSSVKTHMAFADSSHLVVEVEVKTYGRTGVEMEALCAVSAACLSVYDMCKSRDRAMRIMDIYLTHKEGGRSGVWQRDDTV